MKDPIPVYTMLLAIHMLCGSKSTDLDTEVIMVISLIDVSSFSLAEY